MFLFTGDVILSVNGEKVADIGHKQLVTKIKEAGNSLRYDAVKKIHVIGKLTEWAFQGKIQK